MLCGEGAGIKLRAAPMISAREYSASRIKRALKNRSDGFVVRNEREPFDVGARRGGSAGPSCSKARHHVGESACSLHVFSLPACVQGE